MKPGHHVILILVEEEWAVQENQSKMELDEDLESFYKSERWAGGAGGKKFI